MKIAKFLTISLITFIGLLFGIESLLPDHLFFTTDQQTIGLPETSLIAVNTQKRLETCTHDGLDHLEWKTQLNPETGQPESYWLLPQDWSAEGSKFRGPNGEKIVVSNSNFFQGKKAPRIDELIEKKILPMMGVVDMEIGPIEDIPAIAANHRLQAGNPENASFSSKAISYETMNKKGISIVCYGVQAINGEEKAFYHVTDFSSAPEYFEQAKAHFLQAIQNMRETPPTETASVDTYPSNPGFDQISYGQTSAVN